MRPNTREGRRVRALLEQRRDELLARYRSARQRADEELADHPVELVDIANDQWDARVISLVGESDAAQLAEIDAALRRLARGEYGTCMTCGRRIGAARLQVSPAAARCAHCAAYAEHRQHAG